MSENNHTPGPWIVDHGEAIRIKSKNGTVSIATNLKRGGRREPQEVEANARLIAAAPDMLDALEEALKELYRVSPSQATPVVRAAIAKARGEISEPKDAMEGRR